jgi:hypothetical protein
MTITPVATTDVSNYISSADGTRSTAQVVIAVNPDGTAVNVNSVFTPTRINTATTTVVKGTPGVLHAVTVNTKGTVASTVTVYNNTSATGTIVAIIDSLNLSGQFLFDVTMSLGITVVTTGTAAPDITVAWR